MVFPDHTACTDPGNIVGGAGGGGGGGWGPGPSATSFFSQQLNLRFFLKENIIFQERVQHFPGGGGGGGGGGGSNFTGGVGGSKYKNPNNL